MQLYAGSSGQFIDDTVENRIAGKLTESFVQQFCRQPSPSEIASWHNSLRAMCNVFQYGHLFDQGVVLEYQLPLTSQRLDCKLMGRCRWPFQCGHRRVEAMVNGPTE